MANKRLTDLTELTEPADNDFLYIVDVSDTTESAQGTSKKIRKDKVDSGASKENIANKSDSYTVSSSTTYASTKALVDGLGTKANLDVTKKIFTAEINNIDGNLGQLVSENLAETTTYTAGFFVNWVNGTLNANVLYTASDYIPVIYGVKYFYKTVGSTMVGYGAWYDQNNTFISGFQAGSSNAIITPPSGAKFVRLTYSNVSNLNSFYFYETLKFTSYGDSITAGNQWQPLLSEYFSLVSRVEGTGGAPLSGSTGTSLNLDANLSSIPSDSDIITLLAGTNDWAQSKVLGSVNSTNINEFYGALNTIFYKLKINHPNAIIIALATTYGEYPNYAGFSDPVGILNNQGLSTLDYANAVITASKNHNIRFVRTDNLWNNFNIANFVTFDGAYLHPNSEGGKLMASKISLDICQDILLKKINNLRDDLRGNLHTTGDETKTGVLTLNPNVSSVSNYAKGALITPSLTATANSGNLVGLEILPTFNSGGFTGISNIGLRHSGNIIPTSNLGSNIGSFSLSYGSIFSLNFAGTSGFDTSIKGGNGVIFYVNNSSPRAKFFNITGNLALNTGEAFVDDGVNKLQVAGTVSSGTTTLGNTPPTANNQLTRKDYVDTANALKSPLTSPAFTGTPTAPTATVGTNTTQIATTAFAQGIRPYKVYTALLTQVGTDAPTAIVLENTIGAIVWSRSVIGGYFATLSEAFTTGKTSVLITNGSANSTYIHGAQVSTSNVNVITLADGQIDKATIEIRVYN